MGKAAQKRKITIWAAIAVISLIMVLVCVMYVSDYYRANTEAIAAFAPTDSIAEQKLDNSALAYIPEKPVAGFIFYPGGKVEYTAYAPLMKACAAENILCVLVEMPFNLAVLDIDAAKGIQEQYPEIENWYIGGHSLGGSMAASYLAEHIEEFEGLILLGSYSTADLSEGAVEVLSVYGSEDKVLNREKYAENISNLPADYTAIVIEGGCHSYPFVVGATLEATSWDNIAAVSKFGQAPNYWKVGDKKNITVNGVTYAAQIIGFDHDTLTTADGSRTKAGITFQLVDCLKTTYSMNGSNTNVNGWRGSTMRTSTMATLLNQLSSDLKSVLKFVNKVTSVGNNSSGLETTSDKLFLLSEIEVFGATQYSYAGEGKQYEYGLQAGQAASRHGNEDGRAYP